VRFCAAGAVVRVAGSIAIDLLVRHYICISLALPLAVFSCRRAWLLVFANQLCVWRNAAPVQMLVKVTHVRQLPVTHPYLMPSCV
jgi:hypothetical protein